MDNTKKEKVYYTVRTYPQFKKEIKALVAELNLSHEFNRMKEQKARRK